MFCAFATSKIRYNIENIQHRRFANGASWECLLTPALIASESASGHDERLTEREGGGGGGGTSTEVRRRRGELCRACGAPDKKRWDAVGARRGAKTRDEAQNPGAAGPSFERLSLSVLPARYERTMLCMCAQRMHSAASPSASTSIACIAIERTSLRLFVELRMLKRGVK